MKPLVVSEMFYSIQGEGVFIGTPAVFLRLTGCNLTCGGATTITSQRIEDKATWRCDSIDVWTKGKKQSYEEICVFWEENHWIDYLKQGAHVVITGGEPLLQSSALASFLEFFKARYTWVPFIEIETNGTVIPDLNLVSYINQYNIAFKLTNSGMKRNDYFSTKAIQFFAQKENVTYKFVVASEADLEEIETTYIQPFKLNPKNIMLMPAADNRSELSRLEPLVTEWCKQRSWRLSTRLHIHIWDKKTGV